MIYLVGLAVSVAIILLVVFFATGKNKKETARLLDEGKVIKRANEFYREASWFATSTHSLAEIAKKINCDTLSSEGILMESHEDKGYIAFFNREKAGASFDAYLREQRNSPEIGPYRYRLMLEKWTEFNEMITAADLFGANVLLTAVEKAFLALDPDAEVTREEVKTNSRTNFI